MRKHLAILGIVGLVATGCDGSTVGTLSKPGVAISATGQAVVSINTSTSSRATQARIADVDTLEVSLTSAQPPATNVITKAQIASGTGSTTFTGIPAGLATFAVSAFDAARVNIGNATASVTIIKDQTSNVAIALKLDPTLITSTGSGSANAQITISDGDEVPDASASAPGSYDPKADTITEFDLHPFTSDHPSDPNKVRATLTPYAYAPGGQVKWTSGYIRVEYTVEDYWHSMVAASGSFWLSNWQDVRYIDLPRRVSPQNAILRLKVTKPNGGIIINTDSYRINLFT